MIEVYKITNYNSKIYINNILHPIPHGTYTLDNLSQCITSIIEDATDELYAAIVNIIRTSPRVWSVCIQSKHNIRWNIHKTRIESKRAYENIYTDLIKNNGARSDLMKLHNKKFYYSPPIDNGLVIINMKNPLEHIKIKINVKYMNNTDLLSVIGDSTNKDKIVNIYFDKMCVASYALGSDDNIYFSTMENETIKNKKIEKSLLPCIICIWVIIIVFVIINNYWNK